MPFPWKKLSKLTDSEIDNLLDARSTLEEFDAQPLQMADGAGGAPTGTTGDENLLAARKNLFEWHVLGTQTIVQLSYDANGLEVAQDQTDNDGIEVSQGITARSKSAYVVGTDRFFAQLRVKLADVSGSDDCAFGFRKAEAYQANIDDYDEMAVLNVISGNVTIETIINAAATVVTDTTENVADTEYVDLRLEVELDGSVRFKVGINGATVDVPTVNANFTFDTAEVVIPFFYFLHASDLCDTVYLQKWECGLLS